MAKTYRVGVIGSTGKGNYGHGIDTVWLDVPNAKIVAVADENEAGRARKAQSLKADQAFADYREMLDKTKPDIVSICPRWLDQHRDMALAAAQRGIHMYMEKPFCRTLAEADEIVAACEKSDAKLCLAHQSRFSPKIQTVRDLLESGKLGRVLEFRGRGKEDTRGGSEDLWVLGSHIMDYIRNFGGEAEWCFASVLKGDRPITKSDVVEGPEGIGPLAGDGVRAMYGMPHGATAYFGSYKGMGGGKSRFALQIFGSLGVLEIVTGYLPDVKFLPDPAWSPGRSGINWQNVSSAGIDAPEPLKDGGMHAGNLAAVKDLLAAIEQDRQPECSMYEGRGAIEMIVAVFESQRVGGPVKLPLKNRRNPLTMLEA
jgi:predicted dehydrogenase